MRDRRSPRAATLLSALVAALLCLVPRAALAAGPPVKVIFDTDMAGDVDDVGRAGHPARAWPTSARRRSWPSASRRATKTSGPCVDAINTWYGRPDIPIGYQRGIQVGYPADTGETIDVEIRGGGAKVVPASTWPAAAMRPTPPSSIAGSWPRSRTRAS